MTGNAPAVIKAGRPRTIERDRKDTSHCVSAWIDYSDVAALRRIAKRDNKTRSELVRTYITWGIEHDKR